MNRRQTAPRGKPHRFAPLLLCLPLSWISVASAAEQQNGSFTDLVFNSYSFQGRGHKGPYFLMHAQVLPGSETLLIDHTPRARGVDYTVDYAEGILRLAKPAAADQQVTIRYAHPKAVPPRQAPSISAPTDLYKSDTSQVKLLAGYRETEKGDAFGTYGLDASSSWVPHLKVSSLFLVSDQVERSAGTSLFDTTSRSATDRPNGDTPDKTALLTTAALDAGRSRVEANFTRVGEDFRPGAGDANKLAPGTKKLDLKATHQASDSVAVRAAHSEVEQQKQGSVVSDTKTTAGGVNLKLGAQSGVDVGTTRTEVAGKPTTQTHQLTGRTQATDQIAVGVTATRTDVDGGSRTDTQQITSNVRPSDQVNVDLALGRTAVNGETATQTRQVKSALKPRDDLNVVATYTETDHLKQQTETRNIALQAASGEAVKLGGSFSESRSPNGDPTKGHTADLEYQPLQGIKLIGSIAEQAAGDTSRTATGGALMARLRHDLQLRGAYTDRRSDGLPEVGDTREFQLSYTPFEKLSLQAQLADRPAKKLWEAQALEQRSLRLGSQLSPSVNVSGGYSTQEWLDSNRTTDVTDVRLQVDFFGRHSLYAGLTLTDTLTQDNPFRESLYSLGYAYRLGSTFSLSVDGTVTERKSGGSDSSLNDRPDYNVEGKLRAHF